MYDENGAIDVMRYGQLVSKPGKFEGLPTFVPYLYEFEMLYSADDDVFLPIIDEDEFSSVEPPSYDVRISYFILQNKEQEIFSELANAYSIGIWEDDNGDINYAKFVSQDQFNEFCRAW